MNDREPVSSKRNTVRLIPVVLIFLSFTLSAVLFFVAYGKMDARIVVFSAVVIIPQSLGIAFLMRINNAPASGVQEAVPAAGTPEVTEAVPVPVVPQQAEADDASEISAAVCDIAARTQLLCPVMEELCTSISRTLSSTTEPISAELLHIKQSSKTFLSNISAFESDVKDKAAITRLRSESDDFNRDLKGLSGTIQDVFATIDEHMGELKTVSGHIGDIAGDIGEISEQIRILSFNASIEAARAGNAGSGFRIIAGEIKRLSSDTENRLAEIRKMLNETRGIFSNIASGLGDNKNKILEVVTQRQNGFSVFEHTLEDYFPKLESLYDGVIGIINSLTKSMDVISPVVQLHEITSQEIGNLNLVAGDFCAYVGEKAETVCPASLPPLDKDKAATVASAVRRRLTTENELRALERGIKKTVSDAEIDLSINNRGIELF